MLCAKTSLLGIERAISVGVKRAKMIAAVSRKCLSENTPRINKTIKLSSTNKIKAVIKNGPRKSRSGALR